MGALQQITLIMKSYNKISSFIWVRSAHFLSLSAKLLTKQEHMYRPSPVSCPSSKSRSLLVEDCQEPPGCPGNSQGQLVYLEKWPVCASFPCYLAASLGDLLAPLFPLWEEGNLRPPLSSRCCLPGSFSVAFKVMWLGKALSGLVAKNGSSSSQLKLFFPKT
jgi:hypothetical protein